jgi:hypothetical protein
VLEKMMFRPKGKIMINGLPRTMRNRKMRPLTTRRKEKKNTIEYVRKKKRTRTTNRSRGRVETRDMSKKNSLSKRRKRSHFFLKKIFLRK